MRILNNEAFDDYLHIDDEPQTMFFLIPSKRTQKDLKYYLRCVLRCYKDHLFPLSLDFIFISL